MFTPRPYQNDARAGVLRAFRTSRSSLAIMPTGTGKTVLFADLIKRAAKRCLVIAHRDELITQAADKIMQATGLRPEVEKAESFARRTWNPALSNTVVSSVQTLSKSERLRSFGEDAFGLIVVDEAHRCAKENKSYTSILDYFKSAYVLGVTATPDRKDKRLIVGPDKNFQSVAYEYLLPQAIDDGWLVPIRQGYVTVHDLDLSNVCIKRGDFDENELAEIMLRDRHLHEVVEPAIRLAGDRQSIVFGVNVEHATELSKMFNNYQPESTVVMSGRIRDVQYRRRVVERFKAGEIRRLCNCDVYTEGFDVPSLSVIINAAPTRSRTKYVQRVGRSTRPIPSAEVDKYESAEDRRSAIALSEKPSALILDFTGKTRDLSLSVSMADILANAQLDDETRQSVVNRAKKLIDDGETDDVDAALERAENLVDEEKRNSVRSQTKFTYEEVDPFELAQTLASPAQRGLIAKLMKREPALGLTAKQAKAAIYRLFFRRGTCSEAQVALLKKYGYSLDSISALSHHSAEALLRQIRSRKDATNPEGLDAIGDGAARRGVESVPV